MWKKWKARVLIIVVVVNQLSFDFFFFNVHQNFSGLELLFSINSQGIFFACLVHELFISSFFRKKSINFSSVQDYLFIKSRDPFV